jgi:hypothetical protein
MRSVNSLLERSLRIVEDEPLIAPELQSALHDARPESSLPPP